MKVLKSISLLILCLIIVSCAQKGDVSKNAQQAFDQRFPNAKKVSWDKENSQEWEAEFKMNGKEYSANFNNDGDWLETESEIDESEVPSEVMASVKGKYPSIKIDEVNKIERKDGISYEFEVKLNGDKQEIFVSTTGEILSIKKDSEIEEYQQDTDD